MDSGTHEGQYWVSTWGCWRFCGPGPSASRHALRLTLPQLGPHPKTAQRLRASSPLRNNCCTAQARSPDRPSPSTTKHFFTSGKALCRRGEGPSHFPGRFLYSIFLAVLCPCVLRGCDPASQGLVCLSPSPTCACAPVYPRRPPPASPPAPGIPPTCSPCSLGRPRGGRQPG